MRGGRLVDALMREQAAGRLIYRGSSTGSAYVEIGGRRRVYTTSRMRAWYDGFTVGRGIDTDGRRAAPAAPLADRAPALWVLLTDPPVADRRRMQVIAATERASIGVAELAELIDRNRHSVRAALRFGRPILRKGRTPTLEVLEQALAGPLADMYGADFPDGARWPTGRLAAPAEMPAEPAGVRRARCLAFADERRLLVWRHPLAPDEVRRAPSFTIGLPAGPALTLPASSLVPWLQGVADGAGDGPAADAMTDRRNPLHRVEDFPASG